MPDGCDSVYCHSHTQSDDVFIYTAAELTMRGDINENVQLQHWVKKKKKYQCVFLLTLLKISQQRR